MDVVPATFAKQDNHRTFELRRLMVEAASKDLKTVAVSTVQKDLQIETINTIEQSTRYWKTFRQLTNGGKITWVLGSDVWKSMVYWPEVAIFCLSQVDHVIIGTRSENRDNMWKVLD